MNLLSLLLFFNAAFAERTVVIQNENMDDLEYAAQMTAHANYVSPIDAYIQSRPDAKKKAELLDRYAESQLAFVSGNLEQAKKQLGEIVELRTAEDWSLSERRVLVHASLRLAQLSDDEAEQREHLESALAIDPSLKPDASLFPPPLLQKLDSLRQSQVRAPLLQWLKASGWKAVLVNGQRCDMNHCAPPFKSSRLSRLTWLSNSHQAVTTIAALGDSMTVPPLGAKVPFKGIDLNPKPNAPNEISLFTEPKTSKSVLKSPWLWAGVGVVVAVIVASQSQGSKDRDPSTTYGY